MNKRCQKLFENGKRCSKYVIGTSKYCEKHRQLFKYQTYSVGTRKFDGESTSTRYEKYIQSDQWKEKAKQTRAFWNNSCSLCHRKGELHVHHSTYVRLGNERHGDLIVLCENCHSIFHKFYVYDNRVGYFVPK